MLAGHGKSLIHSGSHTIELDPLLGHGLRARPLPRLELALLLGFLVLIDLSLQLTGFLAQLLGLGRGQSVCKLHRRTAGHHKQRFLGERKIGGGVHHYLEQLHYPTSQTLESVAHVLPHLLFLLLQEALDLVMRVLIQFSTAHLVQLRWRGGWGRE